MDELVGTETLRYAVICARSEPDHERLVLAYPNEEALRDLIAAPSIVSLGYGSRADALKNIDVGCTASLKRPLKTAMLHTTRTILSECRVTLRRYAGGSAHSEGSKVVRNLLRSGLTAALIFFYSRNMLSSALRAFISF